MSDLSIIKGETFSHVYTIVDTDGGAVNLTGYTLTAFAQPQAQIPNEKTQIPITIIAAVLVNGTVTVTIPVETSANFTTNNPIVLLLQATKGLCLTIFGSITSDGVTVISFPELFLDPTEVVKTWKDEPSLGAAPDYAIFGSSGNWIIFYGPIGNLFTSTDAVSSPELVTTWTPVGLATGTFSINITNSLILKHSLLTPPILIHPSLPNG